MGVAGSSGITTPCPASGVGTWDMYVRKNNESQVKIKFVDTCVRKTAMDLQNLYQLKQHSVTDCTYL
jgi:hypothetical protein